MPAQAKKLTVNDLAAKLDAEPRQLRAFLRRTEQAVGRGARYEFDAATVKRIAAAWNNDQAKSAATTQTGGEKA